MAATILRAAVALALLSAGPGWAQAELFADDFESGNLFRWSARLGEPLEPAEAFRIADLDLRDPHVYLDLGFPLGCRDFTDQDLPLAPGSALNARIATSLTADGDGDGLLDASPLLAFRPFDESAAGLRLDVQSGLCLAPAAGTTCAPDPQSVPQTARYDGVAAGVCLAPVAGTTYAPYAPEAPEPLAPGFASQARALAFDLDGLTVPLRAARLAASFVGTPVAELDTGLWMGFLAESDADQIPLPPDLPGVGGQPLSILLPGGTGNCAGHDDRDLFEGVTGWWFYFEYVAEPVPWTGE